MRCRRCCVWQVTHTDGRHPRPPPGLRFRVEVASWAAAGSKGVTREDERGRLAKWRRGGGKIWDLRLRRADALTFATVTAGQTSRQSSSGSSDLGGASSGPSTCDAAPLKNCFGVGLAPGRSAEGHPRKWLKKKKKSINIHTRPGRDSSPFSSTCFHRRISVCALFQGRGAANKEQAPDGED